MYQAVFLAVTISLASNALADILVQPGYEHKYQQHVPYQTVPQHQTSHAAEQYHTQQSSQQLLNPRLMQYLMGVHAIHPNYKTYQDPRSPMVGYPLYYHTPRRHLHLARFGGMGFIRPSTVIGGPHIPLTVQGRYRRTCETATNVASNKPDTYDHVAPESSLTNPAYSTVVDSYLSESEPINTNDKHVEIRQSKNDQANGPLLFSLYPKIEPGHTQIQRDIIKHSLPSTPTPDDNEENKQSNTNPIQDQPTKTKVTQGGSHVNWKDLFHAFALQSTHQGDHSISLSPDSYRDASLLPLIAAGLVTPSQSASQNQPNFYNPIYNTAWRNFPDPRLTHSLQSSKSESLNQQNVQTSNKFLKISDNIDDENLIETNHQPNSGRIDESFRMMPPNNYATYEMPSFQTYIPLLPYEEHNYPHSVNLNYAVYEDTENNLPTFDRIVTSLNDEVRTLYPQTQQFSSAYNYPMRYVTLPQTYKYYYGSPVSNYESVSFYDTPTYSAYY